MRNFIQKSARIQETAAGTSLTITAPGAGKYICLESLVVESSAACDLTVTSGGTTLFQVGLQADAGLDKYWEGQPLRGLENSSMVVTLSAGAGTLNAQGFVTP